MDNKKKTPTPEMYGWHSQQGFDYMESGYICPECGIEHISDTELCDTCMIKQEMTGEDVTWMPTITDTRIKAFEIK